MIGPILGGNPFLRYGANVNIVCDGNSLTNGHGTGTPYPTQLAALPPLNGGVVVRNFGISGQTTQQMSSSATDVDGAWVDGKTNILVAWEGTNSMTLGRTAAQSVQDMTAYIQARLAVHPWIVLLLTTTPRQVAGRTEAQNITLNGSIDTYNATLRSTYEDMGANVLVETRPTGGPFALTTYTNAAFSATEPSGVWAAGESGGLTHFSTAGYAVIAGYVAAALRRIPARPST